MTRSVILYARVVVLSLLLALCLALPAVADSGDVITVGETGADFTSIQEAIDAAPEGGTVEIQAGMYTENVSIGKPLTLRADSLVIVYAADPILPVIMIHETAGVTIEHVRVRGGEIGIGVFDASATIRDCSLKATETALSIVAFGPQQIRIEGCDFVEAERGIGLGVLGSAVVEVVDSAFTGLPTGGLIGGAIGTTAFTRCTFTRCYDGLVIGGAANVVLTDVTFSNCYGTPYRIEALPVDHEPGTFVETGTVIE